MPQLSQTVEFRQMSVLPDSRDAHCHLNLFDDPMSVVDDARDKGVHTILAAGGSAKDNVEVANLAKMPGVFAVVGISPDFLSADGKYIEKLRDLVKSTSGVVGIGEIGLDTKAINVNSLLLQKKAFELQVDLACELEIPVVIHSRGALSEVMEVLERKKVRKAMFHFFDGDEIQARELASKGYLISIPPAENARRKKVIKSINLSSIVAETDSPIVGKTPVDTIGVCEAIAKLKGMSLEDVAMATTENIRRLFYI